MKRYRVYWTDSAIQDLAEIARYVGKERPIVAKGLIDKIALKSKALTTSPERCRVVAEIAPGRPQNLCYCSSRWPQKYRRLTFSTTTPGI